MTADDWASSICSKLEAASHYAPRGKHARHADIMQLVRITAPNLDSVLNSVKDLADVHQLSRRRQENVSDNCLVKNNQSTIS